MLILNFFFKDESQKMQKSKWKLKIKKLKIIRFFSFPFFDFHKNNDFRKPGAGSRLHIYSQVNP